MLTKSRTLSTREDSCLTDLSENVEHRQKLCESCGVLIARTKGFDWVLKSGACDVYGVFAVTIKQFHWKHGLWNKKLVDGHGS